ncbi:MAG: hypothetical protein AAGB01_10730 [Cyanobacteria bacterium P01_F01_bin.42]
MKRQLLLLTSIGRSPLPVPGMPHGSRIATALVGSTAVDKQRIPASSAL